MVIMNVLACSTGEWAKDSTNVRVKPDEGRIGRGATSGIEVRNGISGGTTPTLQLAGVSGLTIDWQVEVTPPEANWENGVRATAGYARDAV